MKTLVSCILFAAVAIAGLSLIKTQAVATGPQEQPHWQPVPQVSPFTTIEVTIDPQGQSLGAFQFELTAKHGSFTVVGVEAGGHAAFDHGRPPYFDREAELNNTDRVILAEYAKPNLDAEQLPTKPVVVAVVHVMFDQPVDRDNPVALQLNLTTAGNAEGEPIDATASYRFRNPERTR